MVKGTELLNTNVHKITDFSQIVFQRQKQNKKFNINSQKLIVSWLLLLLLLLLYQLLGIQA